MNRHFLHHDDVARFDVLLNHDGAMQQAIEDSAELWRGRLTRIYPDLEERREAFLVHSVIMAARHGIQHGSCTETTPTLAIYICRRVEKRAAELDAQEWK